MSREFLNIPGETEGIETNKCSTKIILKGSKKNIGKFLTAYKNQKYLNTILIDYIGNNYGEVSKTLVHDLMTISGDTVIDYIDELEDTRLEMLLEDDGIVNYNGLRLLFKLFNLTATYLVMNIDGELFINTDSTGKLFKHNIVILTDDSIPVMYGEDTDDIFNGLGIIGDSRTDYDLILELAKRGYTMNYFKKVFPDYILKTNEDLYRRYIKILKLV